VQLDFVNLDMACCWALALGNGGDFMVRYGGTLAVAMLLIVAGFLYVRQLERSIEQQVRQRLGEAKAAGKLPPEIEPEGTDLTGIGVHLPVSEMRRSELAHLLVAWRFVLIPLVLLGSLVVARMLKRR
jgi:hypothetical protein